MITNKIKNIVSTALITFSCFIFQELPTQSQSNGLNNFPIITTEGQQGTENGEQFKSNNPRRLSITVSVDNPDDLKVSEGARIKENQVIATRDRARKELQRQKQQMQLSLTKIKSFKPLPPTVPQDIPPLAVLPPTSFLEQEALVEKAETKISFIERQINTKEEEISFLNGLSKVDPVMIKHEEAKLGKLKQELAIAIKDYQVAKGKLETARNNREYQEYLDKLNQARRIEQINQQRQNYERELALYQERRKDQEFKITQLNNNLNNVEEKLKTLSNTTSPYSGTIRRIKWLGQTADGILTAEISLMVEEK